MIRPVLGTVAARIAITVMNLLLVAVVGQRLGAAGLGTIGLVVLGVTLILLMGHVVGGGGLVYLIPRHGVRPLLGPSYTWAILTACTALAVVHVLPLAPKGYELHVVALAFIQSISAIHLNVLVARERIGTQNLVQMGQMALQLMLFVGLVQVDPPEVMDYLVAAYVAHGCAALVSGILIARHWGESTGKGRRAMLLDLAAQGTLAQGANLLQLLNYRLAYYLVEYFQGRAALGIYSVTTQLAESTWLVPKSIGGVLYSKVSNLEEVERQRALAVILLKISLLAGAACCGALLLLPDSVYGFVFGPEIHGLRPLILLLAPGLLAMSASQVLSHYLSGTGRIMHNTIGSGLGLLVTLGAGFWLIPVHGLSGAATTASLAYGSSVIYQLVVFLRTTRTRPMELLPHAGDRARMASVWERIARRIAR